MSKLYSIPQTQSKLGVILIFLSQFYKFLRAFGAALIYFFVKGINSEILNNVLLGTGFFIILLLIYSVIAFLRFKFHINYANSEFVLEKGVFNTEKVNVPFNKIQQVYFKRSLLQRAIGVYSLVLDTAGSSGKEISIKALREADAKKLQQVLIDVAKVEEDAPATNDVLIKEFVSNPSNAWEHKLSPATLIKLGLTSNYFRGVWLILIFVVTIYQQLGDFEFIQSDMYTDSVQGYLEAYSRPIELFILTAIVFTVIFLLGLLISCIEIFIKYFDLKLQQTNDSLELEMGLKTNTKTSLKPRRVQLLRVITNPIQKRLNLHEVQIAIASSQNDLTKTKIQIPGLERIQVEKVKKFLFTYKVKPGNLFKPAVYLYFRLIILAALPLLLTGVVASFLVPNYLIEVTSILSIIYVGIVIPYQYFWYRALSLEITPEFVIIKKGVWNQKVEIIELFKLQAITVNQPLWYKKRKLYNYIFHTAGGDLSFPLTSELVQKQINYALFRVEIDHQPWM
ncbi:PH domain-containing protein [Leeuwenhoekiella sp. MAR_2009_132]|uniref:PH domain-containing protein n=1 Tax=Leeuwenhoekiella sp. MAR_2009_132 TaxID=1392489 RepID=UPI00048C7AFC|nr:PH domain-containing protein [Leeuwenhoekiella sp. MAR_2009_132]